MKATRHGRLVKEPITSRLSNGKEYPLMSGDILVNEREGSWVKECPGVTVIVRVDAADIEAKSVPIEFYSVGLNYTIVKEG